MIYLIIGLCVYVILMTISNIIEQKRVWNKIIILENNLTYILNKEHENKRSETFVSGDVIEIKTNKKD